MLTSVACVFHVFLSRLGNISSLKCGPINVPQDSSLGQQHIFKTSIILHTLRFVVGLTLRTVMAGPLLILMSFNLPVQRHHQHRRVALLQRTDQNFYPAGGEHVPHGGWCTRPQDLSPTQGERPDSSEVPEFPLWPRPGPPGTPGVRQSRCISLFDWKPFRPTWKLRLDATRDALICVGSMRGPSGLMRGHICVLRCRCDGVAVICYFGRWSFLITLSLIESLQGPSFFPPGNGSQVAKKTLSNIIAAKTIKVPSVLHMLLMIWCLFLRCCIRPPLFLSSFYWLFFLQAWITDVALRCKIDVY